MLTGRAFGLCENLARCLRRRISRLRSPRNSRSVFRKMPAVSPPRPGAQQCVSHRVALNSASEFPSNPFDANSRLGRESFLFLPSPIRCVSNPIAEKIHGEAGALCEPASRIIVDARSSIRLPTRPCPPPTATGDFSCLRPLIATNRITLVAPRASSGQRRPRLDRAYAGC